MKVNEVAGIGNWNTAEFWEYSTRSGHRANPDPVRIPGESPYCAFNGNPIWKTDVKGDFSKAGAWTRNLLQGGSGISKLENGEWGFRKSGVMYENGEKTAVVKMTYNDRVSRNIDFLSKSVSQWGPNFYKWRDRMFDKLNNTWMNHHGTSWDDYAKSRGGANRQKAGIEWTGDGTEQAGMETNTAPHHLFRDAWSMPGSKGEGNAGDALENIVGGISDIRDYISGDKPLIRRVGPRDKSLYDTSDLFQFQKKTWHLRAKDGDTLPAFDGTKQ